MGIKDPFATCEKEDYSFIQILQALYSCPCLWYFLQKKKKKKEKV